MVGEGLLPDRTAWLLTGRGSAALPTRSEEENCSRRCGSSTDTGPWWSG